MSMPETSVYLDQLTVLLLKIIRKELLAFQHTI